VYALITSSPSRVAGTGVVGERLRAVTAGRVTAVVGELPRALRPTIGNLRRYALVIDSVRARVPSILPARFGTVMTDVDELSLALRSRQDTLRRRLASVRGRVQMTLRVVLGSDSSAALVLESDSGAASHASQTRDPSRNASQTRKEPPPISFTNATTRGTRFLQQRAASAARASEIPGFDPIRAAAKRWIREERIEKRAGVATVNHLVPRGSATAYRAAIERAAERAGIRMIVSGPHAPYAFAENW
jgi:hypothetical protein